MIAMKRLFGLLVLMFLFISAFSSEEVVGAVATAASGIGGDEKRTCESKSNGFKGACVSDHNCGLVCKNEGFTDGWCRGARRRCFCTRHC